MPRNLLIKSTATDNVYLDEDGTTLSPYEGSFVSDYIAVTPGETYTFDLYGARSADGLHGFAYYDSNMTKIGAITWVDITPDPYIRTMQAGVAYVRWFPDYEPPFETAEIMVHQGYGRVPYEPAPEDMPAVIPDAVTGLTATYNSSADRIEISWNHIAERDSYTVIINGTEYSTGSSGFTLENPPAGTVAIEVYGVLGSETGPSAETSVNVVRYSTPAQVTGLEATYNQNADRIEISWNHVPDREHYIVTIRGVEYTTTSNSYTQNAPAEGSTTVTVRGVNGPETGPSAQTSVNVIKLVTPDKVTGLEASYDDYTDVLTINWDHIPERDTYVVSIGGVEYTTTGNVFTLEGPTEGTKTVIVYGVIGSQTGDPTQTSITIVKRITPGQILNLTSSYNDDTDILSVNWTADAVAEYYYITINGEAHTPDGNTFELENPPAGPVTIIVRGVTGENWGPTTQTTIDVIKKIIPEQVTGLTAAYNEDTDVLSLYWVHVANRESYTVIINGVEYSTTNNGYTLSDPTEGTAAIEVYAVLGSETGPSATTALEIVKKTEEPDPEDPDPEDPDPEDPDPEDPDPEPEEPEPRPPVYYAQPKAATIEDLEGNVFILEALTETVYELNGNRSISFVVHPTENNKQFINDIDKLWTVTDARDDEYRVIYLNPKGRGDSLNVQVKAIPKAFDDLNVDRIYERIDEHMTAYACFSRIFDGTDYTFTLASSFLAVQWQGFGNGDTRLEMFKEALNRYGAEFELVGNDFRIYHMLGRDTQFMYHYRLNASNVSKEEDAAEYWTYAKGFGDFENEDDEPGLVSEYTSPLASIIGVRHAPPVRDGRITNEGTLQDRLEAVVSSSVKLSITATAHDLREQGYPLLQPEIGDRIFIIDDRIGLDTELRVVSLTEIRNIKGEIIKVNVDLGTQPMGKRREASIKHAASKINDLLTGKTRLPAEALDAAISQAAKALQDAQSQLSFSDEGIIAYDATDPNRLVFFNSEGIGISDDGGATFKQAITSLGINTDLLTAGSIDAQRVKISANGNDVLWVDGNGEVRLNITKMTISALDDEGEPYDFDVGDSIANLTSDIVGKADRSDVAAISDELGAFQTVAATAEELGEIINALNEYKSELDGLEGSLSTATSEISDLLGRFPILENNLGEFTERWNFLDTFMTVGEEGLLIASANQSTGIRITDDRIDFLDGSGEPVAYITNQVMRINRAIFVDSMTVGDHKTETIADGHTIDTYVGDAE